MKTHTEYAFESTVEQILFASGWVKGNLGEWDKERALFPAAVWRYIEATQGELWQQLRGQHGDNLENACLAALGKELTHKGSLHVLRHGFKFYGKTLRMAAFAPAHGLNAAMAAACAANVCSVTRQVPCHPEDNSTVDMLFALNGIPIATCELKNPSTGQNVKHAIRQYQHDRRPHAPLFRFKERALVHFAADPQEVYMTTHLRGDKTFFLPFNRGSHPGEMRCGAGNPAHPSGYPTGYFWQEVLRPGNVLEILAHYVFVQVTESKEYDAQGKPCLTRREAMIFPRYHQWDATRKLFAAAQSEGVGHNYLIQHSAGSGKTNSISWLAHRLSCLHGADDTRLFDCVIVVTDRQVLDRQLQDAIQQIEHVHGVVKAIDEDSRQLAQALVDGTKVVITTLQKFPFVLRGLLRVAGASAADAVSEEERQQARAWEADIASRRYAVIVDEAHSSQTGDAARELKAVLGDLPPANDEDFTWEDNLNRVMETRGPQKNVSFFAFTATPKGKTLELFGRRGGDGTPQAFHVYSMRQAIEEGFILDVVRNYTTYKTFFRLVKNAEDDRELPKRKGLRALARFMELHPTNVSQKTAVIVEHFRQQVRLQLAGKAKAMLVTSSRLAAVTYKLAFERYFKEQGYTDMRALVAFSGTVRDPQTGLEYTEPGMNPDCVTGAPIGEKQLPNRFASPDYQILLVANKYQTGFDQPLLAAMYVDKRLDGVQAVQTLSRLNRMTPGKEAPFVLDFVNEAEDIYKAFKPYYDTTSLQDVTDPHRMEELKHELDGMRVYTWSEVEAFATVFYRPVPKKEYTDHAELERHLTPAVDRFKGLDQETQDRFRDRLMAFGKLYSFLSLIIPYTDKEWEMLASYGRCLLPRLPREGEDGQVHLGDDVSLRYYRLQRVFSGSIDLAQGDEVPVKSPGDMGTGKTQEDKAPLSELIEQLNARFGEGLGEEDRLFFAQIQEKALNTDAIVELGKANSLDRFQLGARRLFDDLLIQRMNDNDRIVTKCLDDDGRYGNLVFEWISRIVYESISNSG